MTLLLTHNVKHFTKHSFKPKNQQPAIKKFWVSVSAEWMSSKIWLNTKIQDLIIFISWNVTIRATVNKTGSNNTLCDQFLGDIHWVHTVRFHSISCWDLSGWGYWLKCCHCLGQLLHFVLCFHQKVMPWWRLRRWLLRLLLCTL